MLNIFKLLFKGRVVGQQGYLHHIHLQNRCLYLRKTGINIYPNRLSHLPSFFKILLLLLNFFNFPFISFSKSITVFFLIFSSCLLLCIQFFRSLQKLCFKNCTNCFCSFSSFLSFLFNKDFV